LGTKVGSVAHVYHSLRQGGEDEKRAAIFCQNYGEAGAIDFSGQSSGCHPTISGHQNYFLWGPRDWTGEVVLVLDTNDDDERGLFGSVEDLPGSEQPLAYAHSKRQRHIYLCRDLKGSVREVWPRVKELVVTPTALEISLEGCLSLSGDSFDELWI